MATKSETKIIRVVTKVYGTGVAKLNTQFKKLNKTLLATGSGLKNIAIVFAGFAAGFGLRSIVQAADTFQLLQDRIKVFTGSATEAKDVMLDLQGAARYARTSIESLATIYNRIAFSTEELGLSQKEMMATVLGLQQTFRIAGNTIAETTATIVQLSQGLASGQVRGQELRSVMEQNTVFAGLLAKELGIARGNLIKFAESGLISSAVVFRTLGNSFKDLNIRARQMGVTFGQAATMLADAFKMLIHEFNQWSKASKIFGAAVDYMLDNMTQFVTATIVTGTAFGAFVIAVLVGIKTITGALIASGWGALLFVVTYAITDMITEWDKWVVGFQIGVKYMELGLKNAAEGISRFIGGTIGGAINVVVEGFRKIITSAKVTLVAITALKPGLAQFTAGIIAELSTLEAGIEKFQEGLKSPDGEFLGQDKTRQEIAALRAEFDRLSKTSGPDYQKALQDAADKLSQMKDKAKIGTGAFQKLNMQLMKGTIHWSDYEAAIAKTNQAKLNQRFVEGKISLNQYYAALTQIPGAEDMITDKSRTMMGAMAGVEASIVKIGDVTKQMASATENVMDSMEDQFVNLATTGEFSFRSLADSFIEELSRMIVKLYIILPLLQAMKSMMNGGMTGSQQVSSAGGQVQSASTSSSGGYTAVAANGLALQGGNVLPFAMGGVVNGPTLFPMANGAGLMGEAGPEAIIPLSRGKDGKLGVQGGASNVVINVTNNSSAEIETEETTNSSGQRQIEMLIVDKVTRAIGSGRLDKSMGQAYGLKRRGA